MNIYIDSDAFVRWEKGEFDLLAYLEDRPNDIPLFPPAVWQQLFYGAFAWEPARARKRESGLNSIGIKVSAFGRRHATRAAQVAADLKREAIGFADCQIAASVLEDGEAELLTFNREHFGRVPGLRLATV